MWPFALAVAGLLELLAAVRLPLPSMLDVLPVLGPLHRLGVPWSAAIEAVVAAAALIGGVSLVGMLYRLSARVSGFDALARFFRDVEDIRSLRPVVILSLVLFSVCAAVQI